MPIINFYSKMRKTHDQISYKCQFWSIILDTDRLTRTKRFEPQHPQGYQEGKNPSTFESKPARKLFSPLNKRNSYFFAFYAFYPAELVGVAAGWKEREREEENPPRLRRKLG